MIFFAGAPQNRKRAILLAAAPNCPLPHFPASMHVFEQMPFNITVQKCASYQGNGGSGQFGAAASKIARILFCGARAK